MEREALYWAKRARMRVQQLHFRTVTPRAKTDKATSASFETARLNWSMGLKPGHRTGSASLADDPMIPWLYSVAEVEDQQISFASFETIRQGQGTRICTSFEPGLLCYTMDPRRRSHDTIISNTMPSRR